MNNLNFRAWHKELKEMCEVHEIKPLNRTFTILLPEPYDYSVTEKYDKPEDIILMQSTGLKDSKGVEIFEGDILSIENEPIKISSQMHINLPDNFEQQEIENYEDGFKIRKGVIKTGFKYGLVEKEICTVTGSIYFKFYEFPKVPNIYTNTYVSFPYYLNECEIVANIYEQPELLEGGV